MSIFRRITVAAVVLIGLSELTSLQALNTSTHALVNLEAARRSLILETYLRRSLGFTDGRLTFLRAGGDRLRIEDWLARGGDREDDILRFLRHFHDPLKPWDVAGLDLGVSRHDSSVRWMQRPHQDGPSTGASWSWRDARRLYYEALTEPNPVRREALWADLFRALGQIMHLVVDASVPEHTRNDIHPLGGVSRRGSYEYWTSRQHGDTGSEQEAQFVADYLSAPIGFDPQILQSAPPAGEGIATVPVARLIDSDTYTGTNPSVTVGQFVGLAEIANANFFSEDTLHGQYPFPTDDGLIPVNLATPFGRVRRYLSRPEGQGLLPANPLRAECASEAHYHRGEIAQPPPYPCLDGVVWNQVAAHMLPRAVGYARGVLDYFFRGALSVQLVYWEFNGVKIRIQNQTDEELDGVFEVYLRHDSSSEEERRERVALLNNGERTTIGPRATVTIPMSLLSTQAASPEAVLVFKGRLGLEADAVIGQIFTVPLVEVVQTAFVSDVVSACTSSRSANSVVNDCQWRSLNMDVRGDFASNVAEPVIARVQARWANQVTPVDLDGITYPVAWQRVGAEPDPVAFRLRVPNANRRTGNLSLDVTLTNGELRFVWLAIFNFGRSTYLKSVGQRSASDWLVLSQRTVDVRVGYMAGIDTRLFPSFTAQSIGGYPNPTFTMRTIDAGNTTIAEGVRVNEGSYQESAVPTYQLFPTDAEARTFYSAVPEPTPPSVLWNADVRRAYRPMELPLMRAFFSSSPPSQVITLRGNPK